VDFDLGDISLWAWQQSDEAGDHGNSELMEAWERLAEAADDVSSALDKE
jgi:hypothetical protein